MQQVTRPAEVMGHVYCLALMDCGERALHKSLTVMPAVLNRHCHGTMMTTMERKQGATADGTGYVAADMLHHFSGSIDLSLAELYREASSSACTALMQSSGIFDGLFRDSSLAPPRPACCLSQPGN